MFGFRRLARRRRRPVSRNIELLEPRYTPSAMLGVEVGALSSNLEGGGKAAAAQGGTKTSYTYSVIGIAANKDVAPTSGGLALVGGGTDVNSVFTWMGGKANGGDFLVLRATGTNAYNNYIDQLVPSLDSVATLIVPNRAAADLTFVSDRILEAEGIFIAGGDQADYINYWAGTLLETALYNALKRHVPIGGTSAGLAILGEIDFSGVNGTITSSEALANPYNSLITLDAGLLNPADSGSSGTPLQLLNDVITDSHFEQRDRMGRLVTFLARMDADNQVPGAPRGIAVNEQTALLVDENGSTTVVGNTYSRKLAPSVQQRSVYFLEGTTTPTNPLSTPLNYSQVRVQLAQVIPGGTSDTFNLATWTGSGVESYFVSAASGVLSSTSTSGSIYGISASTGSSTAIAIQKPLASDAHVDNSVAVLGNANSVALTIGTSPETNTSPTALTDRPVQIESSSVSLSKNRADLEVWTNIGAALDSVAAMT